MINVLNMSELTKSLAEHGVLRDESGYGVIAAFQGAEHEYRALRNHVGLIDLSASGLYLISGEDFVEFVSSLLTKDIDFLDIEKTLTSLMLDEDGHIIDMVSVYRLEQSILIETSAARRDKVGAWLAERKSDGVEIENWNATRTMIGFEGPYAWQLAQTIVPFDISSLPYQAFVEIELEEEPIVFIRSGFTGEYGYKIIVPHDQAIPTWKQLKEWKEEDVLVEPVGFEALEIAMLEVRQPRAQIEANGLSVYEAAVQWFVSYHKEEYVGHAALQQQLQQENKQHLVGFTAADALTIEIGNAVMLSSNKVGRIVQLTYSPTLEKKLGLALLDDACAVSGIELEGINEAGESVVLNTVSSPYVLPKSWSIKMI
ncbi:aminomethyltransferase family protein [Paenibacillus sp. SC116]|uniref:aminomethyltransferase family protein n=1 Tax=Paenibacillus sp. SC116 TaxID=2968986 RepID=UPI00215AF99E|nr:glycine cleavage T C-terminal barrel domain-containing protein [Paenibacillus sp. SC116]